MDQEIETLAARQANIYQLLSNKNRVMILWALLDHEMSVGEIAMAIHSSLQNTSQHLRLMKDGGILASHREGQMIYYSIAENELAQECLLLAKIHRPTAT